MDRHYIPAFRQRTNGSWDDRAALIARADEFRKHIEHATVTVLDELIDGEHYAERHVIDLLQRDGAFRAQGGSRRDRLQTRNAGKAGAIADDRSGLKTGFAAGLREGLRAR